MRRSAFATIFCVAVFAVAPLRSQEAKPNFEAYAPQLSKLFRYTKAGDVKSLEKAVGEFRAWLASPHTGDLHELEKAILVNPDEVKSQRDKLRSRLVDLGGGVQSKLVTAGALDGEVGFEPLSEIREAVQNFRRSESSIAVGDLTPAELAMLDKAEAAFNTFVQFQRIKDERSGRMIVHPKNLVSAKPRNDNDRAWVTYEGENEKIKFDYFFQSSRGSTPAALAAKLLEKRTGIGFKYLDITGAGLAIEAATDKSSGQGRELVFFSADEKDGEVSGYGIRADVEPPVRADIPRMKIAELAASHGNGAQVETPEQRNWRLVLQTISNRMSHEYRLLEDWKPVSRRACKSLSAQRDGDSNGKEKSVNIFYATNRKKLETNDQPGVRPELSKLFGSEIDDHLHLGCLQMRVPRHEVLKTQVGAAASGFRMFMRAGRQTRPPELKVFKPFVTVNQWKGDKIFLRGDEQYGYERALVYIHGYNNGFDDAAMHAAKIAAAADYEGQVYLFSWPSQRSLSGYASDMDYAEQAERDLVYFLKAILSSGDLTRLDIVVHSMGSQVLLRAIDGIKPLFDRRHGENLKDKVRLGQLVFAAPDVSALVFEKKVRELLHYASRVTVYASGNDGPLDFSGMIRGGIQRAGFISNGRPISAPGVHLIDITGDVVPRYLIDRYWCNYHSAFVENGTVLQDLGQILGASQASEKQNPGERSKGRFVELPHPDGKGGKYWKIDNKMLQSGTARDNWRCPQSAW